MKEVWGGGVGAGLTILVGTQQTVNDLSEMLCRERQTVLDIFACWCKYPCISPFV